MAFFLQLVFRGFPSRAIRRLASMAGLGSILLRAPLSFAQAEPPSPAAESQPAPPAATPASSAEPAVDPTEQATLAPPAPETRPRTPSDTTSSRATAESAAATAKIATPASSSSPIEDEDEDEDEDVYDGPATLLGGRDKKISFGGYGGLQVAGTSLNQQIALLTGGEAAFLLDHRLAIGVGGMGLSTEVRGNDFPNGDPSAMAFGYGGGVIRYHFVSERSPLALSIGTLVGGGAFTLLRKVGSSDFEYEIEDADADAFFVVEPSVQGHLYLARWMRLGIGSSYRFVHGAGGLGYKEKDLRGFTFGAHIQFGWF